MSCDWWVVGFTYFVNIGAFVRFLKLILKPTPLSSYSDKLRLSRPSLSRGDKNMVASNKHFMVSNANRFA